MRDAPVAFRNRLIVGTRPTVGVMIAVIAASASAVVFFVMLKCQSPAAGTTTVAAVAAAATAIGLHQSLSYCLFASLAPGPLKDRHAYRSTQPQSQQHRCSKVKAAENKCTYETNLRSLCYAVRLAVTVHLCAIGAKRTAGQVLLPDGSLRFARCLLKCRCRLDWTYGDHRHHRWLSVLSVIDVCVCGSIRIFKLQKLILFQTGILVWADM